MKLWLSSQHVYDALEEFDSLESIRAILVDNTSVNTGWKNGLVVKLEDKLWRNLHAVGCALHQNELPFCAIEKNWMELLQERRVSVDHLGKDIKRTSTVNHKLRLSLLKTLYNIVWKKKI